MPNLSSKSQTPLWRRLGHTHTHTHSAYIGTNGSFCADIQPEKPFKSNRWQQVTCLSERIVRKLGDGGQVFTVSFKGRKYSDRK